MAAAWSGLALGLALLTLDASVVHAESSPPHFAPALSDTSIIRAIEAADHGDDRVALELLAAYVAGPNRGRTWYDARFLAARAAVRLGEPERALFYADGLEAQLPEIRDLISGIRARAYRATGDWERARSAWQRVLEHPASPEHRTALYGIADALFAVGRLEEARVAYESALAIDRRSTAAMTARFCLGRIAEMQGRWADAAEHYRYLAYRYPTRALHEPAQARLSFLADTRLGPEPTLAQRLYQVDRLLASHSVEHAAAAISTITPTVSRSSDHLALDYRRAQLAYRQRDYDVAADIFRDLARRTTPRRRLEYERWLARTLSAAGDTDAAIQVHLDIAARGASETAAREALFKGAWLAYNGGDHTQAMKLFGRFVEEYPEDSAVSDAFWFLGWNAYHSGDLPTAAASLRELRNRSRRASLVQRALYWEGRIAVDMGQRSTAQARFEATRAEQPFSYYGALAGSRLRQLEDLSQIESRGTIFAALGDPRPAVAEPEVESDATSLEPTADELPEAGGMTALREPNLPWGASVFDWQTPEGKRALALMRLGLVADAAHAVERMEPLPGHDATDVHYARARILWGLGDYGLAYRIVGRNFRTALKGNVDAETRAYFHIAYPTAFRELVTPAAEAQGLPPLLVFALIRQESAFDIRARSWASANGLMQIIPRTGAKIAAELGITDYDNALLQDPRTNVRFGTWYLGQLVKKFRGNYALAIGSYNAGPVAMSKWVDLRPGMATDAFVEDIPYRETRNYVKRVVGNLAVYSRLYGDGGVDVPERVPEAYLDNIDF